jgi:hypothetical protein
MKTNEQVLNYCSLRSRGKYTIGNTTLNAISSVPCSIEDGLSKAKGVFNADFYNGHVLHHVASSNNTMYCSFILPFHVGCGGAHYIEEIGS